MDRGVHEFVDEFDARPGSATSLLRTVLGVSTAIGETWLTSGSLVSLMEAVDVSGARTRTALTRLKAKGVVATDVRDGASGYVLTPRAEQLIERDSQRIVAPRFMTADSPWCVVSFSIPEEQRDLRHQLRRRLTWVGCGSVAAALLIAPGFMVDEIEQIVADLDVADRVTLFMVDSIRGATEPAVAVQRWWDLESVWALHDEFRQRVAPDVEAFRASGEPRAAFRTWVRALDAWRPITYVDPALPAEFLPTDWPGNETIPLFLELQDLVREPAAAYVAAVVGDRGPIR
ncbi:PaaX family transcriptional regulator C-terminal domain-containing protein [Nocardioides daeguensis]|uniref:PaaX family transcriptional regulator C-terminal domain-containing protein n=1 Tax=Nocardioides daeguensis TaxID=908359 RepID=A0ABP6V0L4_9ACTN